MTTNRPLHLLCFKALALQCSYLESDKQMTAWQQLTSSLSRRVDGTQTGNYQWDPGLPTCATQQESILLLSAILTNW